MGSRRRQVILAVLALQAAFVGVWASISPRSFYEGFPGFGREWVRPEGPYSEHLVRDLGTLSLALAVATAGAALRVRQMGGDRVIASAWLVYSVPHAAYHLAHRLNLSPLDQVLSLTGLALQVVLPLLLLPKGRGGRGRETDRVPMKMAGPIGPDTSADPGTPAISPMRTPRA